MSPHLLPRIRLSALAAAAALLLAGCSDPPPPAPEPTGAELERAWRIAVGADPLDQTVAQLYAKALNARDAPAVVVEDSEDRAAELAASLAQQPPQEGDDDQRYEMVIARTGPLAEQVDPQAYAELTGAEDASGPAAAAAPDELTEVIEPGLEHAQLFEPGAAVLRSSLMITAATQAELAADSEGEDSMEQLSELDQLGDDCQELTIGIRHGTSSGEDLLDQVYDCEPEQVVVEGEDALVEALITADIDAALMTDSHPGTVQHSLVELADSQRAFPHDQYVPVVTSRIAEEVPGVVDEISAALGDDAMLMLRRLIHGDQGLTPEQAAEYWLVENDFVAEPDDWG